MRSIPDISVTDLRRVNVVGSSGSGKSTFARRLATRLGIPYVELDRVYWKYPDWIEPQEAEFLADLADALKGDEWVLDGNYHRTQPVKWAQVQAIVWLDMPYWLIIYQVITRTIRRSLKKEVLWNGNRESLVKAFFSRDSIILWSLTHLSSNRRQYAAAMASPDYAHISFYRLRSRRQAGQFLASLATPAEKC